MLVRTANKLTNRQEAAAGPTEVELLTEIRDALKK
jgi:large-conductance mechanosensitive channel